MPDTQIIQEAEKIITEKPQEWKKIIYGKKVVLFEFTPADLEQFVKLHREDKHGYMQQYCLKLMTEEEAKKFVATMFLTGQIKCWSVYVKSNRDKQCAGFIYLTHMNSFSACLSGIMDEDIIKGLLKHIKRDEYTFAEDTTRTLTNYLFTEKGYSRLYTRVLANNRRSIALNKKCDFIEEGRFKESFQMDGQLFDVYQFAALKKEWLK